MSLGILTGVAWFLELNTFKIVGLDQFGPIPKSTHQKRIQRVVRKNTKFKPISLLDGNYGRLHNFNMRYITKNLNEAKLVVPNLSNFMHQL
jgi:hypothetical protein